MSKINNEAASRSLLLTASNHAVNRGDDMAKNHSTTPNIIRKTYRYRAYPQSQAVWHKLERTLDLCRNLYNCALEERQTAWERQKCHIPISYFSQANQLSAIKQDLPEYQDVGSQVLQDVLRRLDKAFKAFFRRVQNGENPGYPRFKGKNRYHSFIYPSESGWKLNGNKLKLNKIGTLKLRLHRPIKGQIKTVTILRKAGKWYVCFSVILPKPEPLPKTGKQVGIDVGLESFATLSDGTKVENPRWHRQAEHKLKQTHQKVSKRRKGSKRRAKAVRQLQRAHAKVSNQRRDFHHKLARKLVQSHDLIAFESLNINDMVRNPYLAKSIADAGWGNFLRLLNYKAEEAGREVIAVNPQLTSQLCSGCGERVDKGLSQRWHACPHCGLSVHRDHNSAQNILQWGTTGRGGDLVAGSVEARSPVL
ncbi:MAG: RNA-guided endonuclease InsQ/TnpB family protein [Candidatus Bipolaricaulia bacterium]